jgi:hypothetical protein
MFENITKTLVLIEYLNISVISIRRHPILYTDLEPNSNNLFHIIFNKLALFYFTDNFFYYFFHFYLTTIIAIFSYYIKRLI